MSNTAFDAIETETLTHNLSAETEYAAVMLVDPEAYIITNTMVSPAEFYHPKPRAVVEAVTMCYVDQVTVSRATIVSRLQRLGFWDGTVDSRYLQQLEDQATTRVIEAAVDNANTIRLLYKARMTIQHARAMAQRTTALPFEAEEIARHETEAILATMAQSSSGSRDPSLSSMVETDDDAVAPRYSSGLAWLDNEAYLDGLQKSFVYAIQGQQKGRKTSFTRNIVLNAILNGMSVSWFTMDGTRDEVKHGLIAMLATRYMIEHGIPEAHCRLGTRGTPRDRRSPEQIEAMDWARDQLRGVRVRVYDSKDGIQVIDQVESKMRHDKVVHGADMFVYDYIQKARSTNPRHTGFQHFEEACDRFQTITTSQDLIGLILAQRNEGANAARGENDDAGTKWGGALLAACDAMLETTYNGRETPELFDVSLKFSRYSAVGTVSYVINPASGLILNPENIY